MKCFVTGGAGCVGSHMIDRLMQDGHRVVAFDNLSLGREEFIRPHFSSRRFRFVEGDLLDRARVRRAMRGCDIVFHFAANSDIVKSARHTHIDLEHGTLATYNVLAAMRASRLPRIVFTSSSVVYGEVRKLPIHEDHGPLFPISMYGASKLACEGLISAFCHNFGFRSWIFRFANVIGARATHGVVVDFYRKLRRNPATLEVLGDGRQAKPYIEVGDVVDGMLFGLRRSREPVNYFNLGTRGATRVTAIARAVISAMGLRRVRLRFTGGARGWPGDVPRVGLDVRKLAALGWKARYPTSDQACGAGVRALVEDLRTRG